MMRHHEKFLIFFLIISSTYALELPENIQKIDDYNQQYFTDAAVNITFAVAFIAGVIGILSPCILPLLPAYFSYTFKEKKKMTLMTVVFFLGFALTYVILGLLAGYLGHQSLLMVQSKTLIRIASIFVIVFGIMTLFGKRLTFIKVRSMPGNDPMGVFSFGVLFAISWTGCLGPILSGILGIGAVLGNMAQSGMLLFFYALGNFLPLFALSFFYDGFHLEKKLKGREIVFSIGHRHVKLHSTNVIAGLILLASGLFLIVYGSTKMFNNIDPFNTKLLFYELQNMFL